MPDSSDRLKALRAAWKAQQKATKALMRAYEVNASGFERVRLGKEVQQSMQACLNLLGEITGEPPRKLPPPPLGEAIVPKKGKAHEPNRKRP